jgi:hypothetical protein
MQKMTLGILCLCLNFFAQNANAHHGFSAHFDPDKLIRIEGTVKRFDFINPHGKLYIEATAAGGETIVYNCDLQARSQLIRKGADETLFTVGESIVVMAFEARLDPLHCEFAVGYFADGSSFEMRTVDLARSKFGENQPALLAPGEERTIFGTWIRPGMYGDNSGRGPRSGDDSITAAGMAAVAAFDPITGHPAIQCQPGSPVGQWQPPALATSIRKENKQVIIYHESMDVTRTVHLDVTAHPADFPLSDMGHSIGHFEGDVLIIETAAFAAGVLVGSTLNSAQMTLSERLSINSDTGRLLIEWTMLDPLYFSEPLTGSQQLHSTSHELIRYGCEPELVLTYE